MKYNSDLEMLMKLTADGRRTFEYCKRGDVHRFGYYHFEINGIIINNKKQILLQKRSNSVKIYKNKWAIFTCHQVGDDDFLTSIIKELSQEIKFEIKPENTFLLATKIKTNTKLLIDLNGKQEEYINNSYNSVVCSVSNRKASDFIYDKSRMSKLKWVGFENFKKLVLTEDPSTNFVKNELYITIIEKLEKLFASKDYNRKINDLTETFDRIDEQGQILSGGGYYA